MKKILAILITVLMLIPMFSAFAEATPTEIEFWTFQELHVEFYEKLAEKWNAEHPDQPIKLVPTVYPFDDMHNKLLIALQSGAGAPDMVDIEIGKFANFLKGDIQLASLNDIVEPELDNIVKARVDIYSKDGAYYGICFHIGAAVIFYNADLCEQAGIDYTAIKTWDDFYAAGQKFKAALPEKYWNSVESSDIWHMWPMLAELGGDMTSADGKPSIATPEMAKVLEFNRKLVDEGIAVIAPGTYHHAEEFYGMMNAGDIASIVMPMWYLDRFTNYMPDLAHKIAIAPLPVWEEGEMRSVGQGGTGTAVTLQADNPELTKAFLAYAKLSQTGNIEVWNTLGFDPIRKDVWTMPEVTETENAFTEYYVNSPFAVLAEIKDEIQAHNNNGALPATLDAMKNNVLTRAYYDKDVDMAAMLAEEEAKIMY